MDFFYPCSPESCYGKMRICRVHAGESEMQQGGKSGRILHSRIPQPAGYIPEKNEEEGTIKHNAIAKAHIIGCFAVNYSLRRAGAHQPGDQPQRHRIEQHSQRPPEQQRGTQRSHQAPRHPESKAEGETCCPVRFGAHHSIHIAITCSIIRFPAQDGKQKTPCQDISSLQVIRIAQYQFMTPMSIRCLFYRE